MLTSKRFNNLSLGSPLRGYPGSLGPPRIPTLKGLHNLAAHAQPRGAALYNPFRVAPFVGGTQTQGGGDLALGYGVQLLRS